MNINSKILVGATLLASLQGAASAATLSTVTSIPTGDLLVSRGNGVGNGGGSSQATFAYRNADAAGTEGSRGRGQSFSITSGATETYSISGLTLALANSVGNGTRGAGELTLTVFEYTGTSVDDVANWNTNTGGTSGTQILSATVPVAANTTFTSTHFLRMDFAASELNLNSNTNYGFLFQYTLDSVVGLTSDFTIAFDADLGTAAVAPFGYLLNTGVNADPALAANGGSITRDLNYFIQGTVVPEPSSVVLLGLASLGLLKRRRKQST